MDSETEQADEEADQGNGDRDAVHADSARLSGDELAGLGEKGKVDECGHECCQGQHVKENLRQLVTHVVDDELALDPIFDGGRNHVHK